MSYDDLDVWEAFATDGADALAQVEKSLLELEGGGGGADDVNRLYRGLHTLKGNSGFLELRSVERLAHVCEDLVGLVRDKGVPLDREMVDALLDGLDRLRQGLDHVCARHADVPAESVAQAVDRLRGLVVARGGRGAPAPAPAAPTTDEGFVSFDEEPAGADESDPAVEAVLTLARARLAELLSEGPEDAALALRTLAGPQRLVRLVDALDLLLVQGDHADLGVLEALAEVERAVGADGSLVAALQSRAATRVETTLFDLTGIVAIDGPGAPWRDVAARLRRLRLAAEHRGLPHAADACATLEDRVGRTFQRGVPLPADARADVEAALDQLRQALAEGGSADLAAAKIDSTKALDLPVSAALRAQLTPRHLTELATLRADGQQVYELHADVERTPGLDARLQAFLEAKGRTLVTSAVVETEGVRAYRFLLATLESLTTLRAALAEADPGGKQLAVHWLAVGGPAVDEAPPRARETESRGQEHEKEPEAGRTEFLRIDAQKVSLIMDLAAEIGLAVGAVTHHPQLAGLDLEDFQAASHRLELLVRELQNEVSAMRLVPVAGVFQRMKRVVRDAARRTGKRVELVLEGEDTEIDKVMVDALQEPLVHALRNAVDHGIESEERRLAAQKSPIGRIVLSATHRGGEVSVEVVDDGGGLDRDAIQARAVERGLVARDAVLSDEEITELVFQPGFSSKQSIDELSGRGVGMDAVRASIESIRGRVSLRSQRGKGSRLSMTMPLTLAFVDAMVVRQHDRLFALPIEKVFEVFEARPAQISHTSAEGRTLLDVRGSLVPVLWLHRFWGEPEGGPGEDRLDGRIVVAVQTAQGGLALPVDALLGNQQVMLKPLRGPLTRIRAAAGCGMLRTGDVALALDCERLHA